MRLLFRLTFGSCLALAVGRERNTPLVISFLVVAVLAARRRSPLKALAMLNTQSPSEVVDQEDQGVAKAVDLTEAQVHSPSTVGPHLRLLVAAEEAALVPPRAITMAKRVGQVVVVLVTMRLIGPVLRVLVGLEYREKATQAGGDSILVSLSMQRLAVVAARIVLVVPAPIFQAAVDKAVMVAATEQTFTPTAPPAVRVLERGLVVAVARQ
tara:strand:- start:574 stop:1206 length:633 start_codon:yes stop_codon:yes gene_type:complete